MKKEPWVIRKRNLFYRPNFQGYTANVSQAGQYTEEVAKRHGCNHDGVTAHPISEYAPPEIGTQWIHIKTGHQYVVIGHCMIEQEWEDGVLYKRTDDNESIAIVRPVAQFIDGRFEKINLPTLLPASKG